MNIKNELKFQKSHELSPKAELILNENSDSSGNAQKTHEVSRSHSPMIAAQNG